MNTCKDTTIDKVLAKNDLEFVLEALAGKQYYKNKELVLKI